MNAFAAVFIVSVLGHWMTDANTLPAFSYDAPLPYEYTFGDGVKANLSDSPWFLLGNYRVSIFTHVDGEYELISGERSWARLNQGEKYDTGINASTLTLGGKTYRLAGKGSLAENPSICTRVFGCGYATWTYNIDGIRVERTMRVLPSKNIRGGDAAALISVKVTNVSRGRTTLGYSESVLATFDKDEASRLLKKMSFGHYAEAFPEFWTSYWSGSDNQESSMMGQFQGLPDQSLDYWEIPVYCALRLETIRKYGDRLPGYED